MILFFPAVVRACKGNSAFAVCVPRRPLTRAGRYLCSPVARPSDIWVSLACHLKLNDFHYHIRILYVHMHVHIYIYNINMHTSMYVYVYVPAAVRVGQMQPL